MLLLIGDKKRKKIDFGNYISILTTFDVGSLIGINSPNYHIIHLIYLEDIFMKKLVLTLIILMLSSALFAQKKGAPLLKQGNIVVGGKLAIGAVYGASIGFVGSAEYGLQEGFLNIGDVPTTLGIGGTIGFSSYSEDYFMYGEWSYTNFVILVNGYYHADILKNPKIDTYFMIGLGYNAGSVSWDGPGNYNWSTPSHGGIVFGTGIGGRYYFTPNLAAVAELGVGMGLLRIGIDFKI